MALISSAVVGTNLSELVVEVKGEVFEKALEKAVKKTLKQITVPGFRKGKAPRHMVEKMYGKGVFYEDAVNDVYPAAYEEAVKEAGITPVDSASVEIEEVNDEGVRFKATVTTKPVPELGQYKGVSAVKHESTVTDEDVDKHVAYMREQYARLVPVEDRKTKMGDTAVIDFEGFVDGVPFDGGKGEDYALELGSNTFIPGFEEQVADKAVDEEFDVNVTFPEGYQEESLAGKPAVFKCKVKGIKAKELPVLDDDFAKDISDFDTFDEYRADVKKKMQEHNDEHTAIDFENALLEKVIADMKVELPECMVHSAIHECLNDYGMRLGQNGITLDDFLRYTGKTREDLEESFRPQAVNNVKSRLALEKIAELEGLEAADEDVEKKYADLAEQYKVEVEQVKKFIPAEDIRTDLLCRKAMDLVVANAVVKAPAEEKPAEEAKPAEAPAEETAPTEEVKKPAKKTTARKGTSKKAAEPKTEE